ncbi:FAD-dependent oxidoreductase, partial [Oscillatoriales cyanobacterium LEGE 11467]
MAFDYDIVILGGSPVAIDAAIAANALRARVALVEPHRIGAVKGSAENLPSNLPSNLILPLLQQMQQAQQIGLSWDGDRTVEPKPPTVNFDRLLRWSSAAAANLTEQNAPAVLSSLGIDVIRGDGEFCRQPTLHFAANGRRLRGRNYLLAVGSRAMATGIEGLPETGYLTPQTLLHWLAKEQKPPQELTIIGDDPVAIEIAQILARLGTQVTIVVAGTHMLPYEDPDA